MVVEGGVGVEHDDGPVLVDTGLGNKASDKFRAVYGVENTGTKGPTQLEDALAEAGFAPGDVKWVINTHLHFDHCGWNTIYRDGKAVPTFPKAHYYAPEGEWRHGKLQTERDRISYISDNYDPLIDSGRLTLLNGDQQLLPGISVRVYKGHTEFMQAVIIESQGKKACYVSDLIPTTHHLDLAWGMAFDLYPLDTLYSKKRFYAEAVKENWLVIFTHDPKVPLAYIEQAEDGKYVARPV